VMHDGVVEQIGTPLELFDRPGKLFVAQFIGSPSMNVFDATVQSGAVEGLGARWPLPPDAKTALGAKVKYGIRPTDLRLASDGVPAKVVVVEPTGAETEIVLDVAGTLLTLVMHGRSDARPEQTVHLALDADKAHVFDAASGDRL
jgi:multiple sugar transport system ATP-binding protein